MSRYDLTDFEWRVIEPLLPNKPRGVPRVDDRRVLNGIFWVLRSGAPWADVPARYGPSTTIYNRFNRWVAGEGHRYFMDENDLDAIISETTTGGTWLQTARSAARSRHRKAFQWDDVLAQYEKVLLDLADGT
jgi:transposase